MRLDRRLADEQRGRDLGVAAAPASSTSTSRSRAVSEASRDGAGAVAGGRRANASIRRRVTDGASRASPAAAARTAAMRSARGESLSRNPLAPDRSAS